LRPTWPPTPACAGERRTRKPLDQGRLHLTRIQGACRSPPCVIAQALRAEGAHVVAWQSDVLPAQPICAASSTRSSTTATSYRPGGAQERFVSGMTRSAQKSSPLAALRTRSSAADPKRRTPATSPITLRRLRLSDQRTRLREQHEGALEHARPTSQRSTTRAASSWSGNASPNSRCKISWDARSALDTKSAGPFSVTVTPSARAKSARRRSAAFSAAWIIASSSLDHGIARFVAWKLRLPRARPGRPDGV